MPLSLSELYRQSFNIVDYLVEGDFQSQSVPISTREQIARQVMQSGYPELQSKSPRGRQIWFKSYIEGRLFKDFETLHAARGDYHSRLQALVTALAGLSGNLLKYANLANDLQLNDKLTKTYIEILVLMFIVQRVPAYVKNRAKRLVMQMPKLHYVDTGLACHLLGLRNEAQVLSSQFYGSLVETLIYMELYKQKSWAMEEVTLLHFRDSRQREVDIVMETSDGGIIGIEVKSSASIHASDFKGLMVLAEFAGKKFRCGVMFYNGESVLPFKFGEQIFHALPPTRRSGRSMLTFSIQGFRRDVRSIWPGNRASFDTRLTEKFLVTQGRKYRSSMQIFGEIHHSRHAVIKGDQESVS